MKSKTLVILATALMAMQVLGARKSAPSGGLVQKEYRGNVLSIVNAQNVVAADKIDEIIQSIKLETMLPIEVCVEWPVDDGKALALQEIAKENVGAAVVIVNESGNGRILDSEEGNWAILNVAPLIVDNPKPGILTLRMRKLAWRSIARVLGVGASGRQRSVLDPFNSLQDLDANTSVRVGPEEHNALLEMAKRKDIRTVQMASYRTACYYGWAPAPTNEVQQAIWDEYHTVPTKGLEIKFDEKKGR